MSQENCYESFRNVLTMNLCKILPAEKVGEVLAQVDLTMDDYDIVRKPMEIICQGGIPDIVKVFIASKAVANLSLNTLKQYRYKLANSRGQKSLKRLLLREQQELHLIP